MRGAVRQPRSRDPAHPAARRDYMGCAGNDHHLPGRRQLDTQVQEPGYRACPGMPEPADMPSADPPDLDCAGH